MFQITFKHFVFLKDCHWLFSAKTWQIVIKMKRLLSAPFWITNFICTPGLCLFTLLNQRRHLFVFFISDFLIVLQLFVYFSFLQRLSSSPKGDNTYKEKAIFNMNFMARPFGHSCILLLTSESQILMSILWRTIEKRILKLFVKLILWNQ